MKTNQAPAPDEILICTPEGLRASSDPASTLAAGFREVLRAVNGKRTVADLYAFLPQLDQLKVDIWLDDALRMDLLKRAAPAAAAAAAAPAAGVPFEYGAYIESDAEVAALAKDISKWVKEKPQAAVRARNADLAQTVSLATLQSGEALHVLTNTGVFTASDSGLRPPPMPGEEDPPADAPPGDAADRKRVALIVEDELPDLGTLAGRLGAVGYEIRAVATRKQFVDELNHPQPPDVIFLKLGSKLIDAFKTLDKLRQHPTLKHVAIVITGERPSREDIAKSILLGASGWIVRPYTDEKITAALNGALAGIT